MAIISNGTTIASGGSLSVSANPPSTAGATGTYALLYKDAAGSWTGGTTTSGNLYWANTGSSFSGSVGGTWRAMGYHLQDNNARRTTVYIRIS